MLNIAKERRGLSENKAASGCSWAETIINQEYFIVKLEALVQKNSIKITTEFPGTACTRYKYENWSVGMESKEINKQFNDNQCYHLGGHVTISHKIKERMNEW